MPLLLLVVVSVAAGCGGDRSPAFESVDAADPTSSTISTTSTISATSDGGCADVVDVEIEPGDDGTFTVSATVASADTGWDKYADAWEVRAPDGDVLGVRELLHPHVDEQPFTRSLSGVDIPGDVERVTVAARDSVEGFCGEVFEVPVP